MKSPSVSFLRRSGWLALFLCLPAWGQLLTSPAWRWFPGDTEPPVGWQNLAFNDSSWAVAAQPLHADTRPEGTRLPGFGTAFRSVYLRQSFPANQVGKIGELRLDALAEDGFVAWLNGQEVARHNVPDGVLGRTAAALEPAAQPLSLESVLVSDPSRALADGTNVLAIQLVTATTTGIPNLLWNASLHAELDSLAPTVVAQVPAPGSTVEVLSFAEVIFSEAVTGVDASDLEVNGVPATNVVHLAPGHYRFEFTPPAPGLVVLAFSDGHGITDGLAAPNPLVPSTWNVQINPAANRTKAILSEVVADNYRSLIDEDREYPDWIELANLGDAPLDLRGWALTDDPTDRFKWVFGAATLPANGYLVVYASQKNKTDVTAKTRLHTNFKLSADGEYLALVAPDGEVVSEFAPKFPPLRTDVSFGRLPDAPDRMAYFATPTPNARNSSSGAGFAPEVTFSAASGTYLYDFNLRLSAPGTNVVIRYTLNGTVPTNTSPIYVAPIPVGLSVEVRARAFVEGLLPGPVHSEGYIRLSGDPAHQALFTSTLPILVMSTLRTATIAESRNTPVQFSLHEPVDGLASLLLPPQFVSRGGAKIRGSSSAGLPKTPYAIEFWDEFNEDKKAGILGLPADSEWVLYAPNQYDPVMLHNPFIHQLSRDLGQYSPRTRYVELYVQRASGPLVTNQWMGIYVLEEKPAIDANRLAIDKLQPEDIAVPEVTGGYLLKVDRLDPADGGINFGGGTVAAVDPKEPELETSQRAPQLAYIRKYLTDFNRSLSATNWRDPATGYLPYIELTNWVDYHIVEVLSGNVDSLVLSAYFHKERNGPLKWGPHWDFDRALGSTDGRDVNPRNWQTGPFFGATWWSRVLRDPTAWQLWVDRYQEFRAGAMSRTNMNRLIDQLAAQVAPSQKREEKKWAFMRPRGGSYQAEVNLMKNWLSNRVTYIDSQMTARPTLSSAGGRVEPGFTVTIARAPGATVYYTLDGTDPRRAFGTNEVAPGALLYVGPITINANSRLVARARDVTKRQTGGPLATTPWSAPVAATFTVTAPTLAVTEIMFHPAKPTTADGPDEDEFEFLELRNFSGNSVSLPGYRLSGGVDYTFSAASAVTELAPGARVLVVANTAAFASRYPGVGPIAGEYAGRLGNGGARLALTGPLQEPVFDFDFNDRWQLLADGSGFSLVRAGDGAAANDPAQPGSWELSGRFGGSPGQPDPSPDWPVHRSSLARLSEVYATGNQDGFVELIQTVDGQAPFVPEDISGWWLTDDRRDWRRYRLPAGSVFSPGFFSGRCMVIGQSQLAQASPQPLYLDEEGGEIWLLSANAEGELTGFISGGKYPASEVRRSAGNAEFRASAFPPGEVRLRPQIPSPGRTNDHPLTPPVYFIEIGHDPAPIQEVANEEGEFLVLKNNSGVAIALGSSEQADRPWRIRGDVALDLPAGLRLPSNGSVTLVSFDPVAHPESEHAFRVRNAVPRTVPILGPWRGHLANEGDAIELQRPAEGNNDNSPRYIPLDSVDTRPFSDGAVADGRILRRYGFGFSRRWPVFGLTDLDQDGLPNDWEIAHGLNDSGTGIFAEPLDSDSGPDGDPDGDGFTNRMEFVNGTDPHDALEALRPTVFRGARGNLVFRLAAPAGKIIWLQRASTLSPDGWQNVRALAASGSGDTILTFEETDTDGRFYRLVSE